MGLLFAVHGCDSTLSRGKINHFLQSAGEKYAIFFLLLFLLVIRLYHLGAAPLEIEESWRQADTESIAWNFVSYDFNLFHPNFNYDGPLPNIPALEIQITTYIIAILYKLFGHYYFLARLVPGIFFILSAYYLYLLASIYMSWRGALFTVLIYGILPVNLYYSRAIMPESAALLFWIGGVYYFNIWILSRDREELQRFPRFKKRTPLSTTLTLSSCFLALAIMTKPPVVFVGIPMVYLCIQNFKWKWLKFPELWGYFFFTLGLPAVYYYYSTRIADYKFTLGIGKDIILQEAWAAFYSTEAIVFFKESAPKLIGYIGIFLLVAVLFVLTRKQAMLAVWLGAMVLEVMLIVGPIRALYYLIFLTVPWALLLGNLFDRMFSDSWGKVLCFIALIVIVKNSYDEVKPLYTINTVMQAQIEVVQKVTEQEDLLVVGSYDPCLLSMADRRGWRYNIENDQDIPEDPLDELSYYINKGAKYFVPIQGKVYGDDDGQIMNHIEENYPKIELMKGYPIYVLQETK